MLVGFPCLNHMKRFVVTALITGMCSLHGTQMAYLQHQEIKKLTLLMGQFSYRASTLY